MSEIKLFEVRDESTHIDTIAIKPDPTNERERWLLEHAGYGRTAEAHRHYVLLTFLDGHRALEYDSYEWGLRDGTRTMRAAHIHMEQHWDELESGQVIDVRHILGETEAPCESDQFWGRKAEVLE